MILREDLAGLVFMAMVLALTVVPMPMLLDLMDTPAALAIRTSIRAVLANPGPVALWEVPVTAVLLPDCRPLFVGLAIANSVLGHATGHLDRKLVDCLAVRCRATPHNIVLQVAANPACICIHSKDTGQGCAEAPSP